jgi:hypothetical protein
LITDETTGISSLSKVHVERIPGVSVSYLSQLFVKNPSLILNVDVLCLHVGFNDILLEKTVVEITKDVLSLATRIFEIKDNIILCFSAVLPMPSCNSVQNEKIKSLNKSLQRLQYIHGYIFMSTFTPFLYAGKPRTTLFEIDVFSLNGMGTKKCIQLFLNNLSDQNILYRIGSLSPLM